MNTPSVQGNQQKPRILIVDDNPHMLENFTDSLQEQFEVVTTVSAKEALKIFQLDQEFAVVISDLQMEEMSGVDLLEQIYTMDPNPIRIIISGFMDGADVIDAINRGRIYQYILKPWDLVHLRLILDQAAQKFFLSRENLELSEKLLFNNDLLRRANSYLKDSEQRLRYLSTALINAQENESKRISMELHDELGQSLAALKLQIKVIENEHGGELESSNNALDFKLNELRSFINEIIENVRRLTKNLSPVIIDDLGLDTAIKHLIMSTTKGHNIQCTYDAIALGPLFTGASQHLLYRMIQEGINNVCKHAQASDLALTFGLVRDTYVKAVLCDNGIGFDVDSIQEQPASVKGIGLTAMRERANMLGGGVDIISAPGKGTTITFLIPVQTDNHANA